MDWQEALDMARLASTSGAVARLPVAARRAAERMGWEIESDQFRRLYYGEILQEEQRDDLAALGRIEAR